MAKLKTRKDIEKWLEGQPREVVIVFAARAALRSAPCLVHARTRQSHIFKDAASVIILPAFYGMATALSAGIYPDRAVDVRDAAAAAARAAYADSKEKVNQLLIELFTGKKETTDED